MEPTTTEIILSILLASSIPITLPILIIWIAKKLSRNYRYEDEDEDEDECKNEFNLIELLKQELE